MELLTGNEALAVPAEARGFCISGRVRPRSPFGVALGRAVPPAKAGAATGAGSATRPLAAVEPISNATESLMLIRSKQMQTTVLGRIGRAVAGQPATDMGAAAVSFGRLARAATGAALAAVGGDLLIYVIAARWGVPGEYAAFFNPVTIIVAAVAGVVVAAGALGVLARMSRRPWLIFEVLTTVLTLLSLGAPLQALAGAMPGFPAATTATGITMVAMHLLTGGAIAGLLPALARR